MKVHPSEFIDDELKARGWTLEQLAEKMGGDADINCLSLYLYRLKDPGILLGEESAAGLSRAFGTSDEVWLNLHDAWLREAKR